jgi:hypothetical protein
MVEVTEVAFYALVELHAHNRHENRMEGGTCLGALVELPKYSSYLNGWAPDLTNSHLLQLHQKVLNRK